MNFPAARLHCVLVLLFLSAGSLVAAPRDELLRLVPEKISFCLVAQNLREHRKDLEQSPFRKSLEATPMFQKLLKSPELRSARESTGKVLLELKLTPDELLDELLGDAAVFIWRHSASDPEKERGLLLIHARDARLLETVVERINTTQKKSGEVRELRESTHRSGKYFQRIKAKIEKPGDEEFFALRGNILIFGSDEALLKEVLDRSVALPPVAEKAPPLSERFRGTELDKAIFVWWANPRNFDEDLQTREEKSRGGELAFMKNFRETWKALDDLAFFVTVNEKWSLGVFLRGREKELPVAVRDWLTTGNNPPSLWSVIPPDALFGMAFSLDVPRLTSFTGSFMSPEDRKSIRGSLDMATEKFLGRDKLGVLEEGIGTQWGFWVTAPTAEKVWVPSAILAIQLRDNDSGTRTGEILLDGLQTVSTLIRLTNSRITAEKVRHEGTDIRSLRDEKGFPRNFEPAWAIRSGFLLIATSPDSIRTFQDPARKEPEPLSEVPLVRVSPAGWSKYLSSHEEAIATWFAPVGSDPREWRTMIQELVANLQPFDQIQLVRTTGKASTSLVIRASAVRK